MPYTKFGESVRVLRIKHHEVMGDMEKVVVASLPFLSAVENGKKNVPTDWIEKITSHRTSVSIGICHWLCNSGTFTVAVQ